MLKRVRKNKDYGYYPEKAYTPEMAKEFKSLASSYLELPNEEIMINIYKCLDDYYYDIIGFILNTRRNEVCDMLFHKTLMMYIAPKTFKKAKYKTKKKVKFYPPDARKEMNYFRARCLRNFEEDDIYQILYMQTFYLLEYLHESKERRKNKLNITNYFFYVFPREFIKKIMSVINGLSSVVPYLKEEDIDNDLKYATYIKEIDESYDEELETLTNDWVLGKTCSYPFNKFDYNFRYILKSMYIDGIYKTDVAKSLCISTDWITKTNVINFEGLKYMLDIPQSTIIKRPVPDKGLKNLY